MKCETSNLSCEECIPFKELKVLYEISRALSSTAELKDSIGKSLGIIKEYLSLEKIVVYEYSVDDEWLDAITSAGLTKTEEMRSCYKVGEGATGMAAKSKEPIIVENIHNNVLFLNKSGSKSRDEISYVAVPILIKDELLGVLGARLSKDAKIDFEETIKILTIVCSLLSQVIYTNHLLKKEKKHLREENKFLKEEILNQKSEGGIIGDSPKIKAVFDVISKVANSKATVLIRGETGTGKELVAKSIHAQSKRKEKPYIKLNCAAIPESLLESELFGHEKGAFTDARELRKGRFELADGGTLFLDEIGDISAALQVKLLRVLQEQEFERVGGSKSIKVDVRIIAATNRDLEGMVESGEFREDLFYRLNVIPLELPPLRERDGDIEALAQYFLKIFNKIHAKNISLNSATIQILSSYAWYGNIRELENTMERVVLLSSDGELDEELLKNMLPGLKESKEVKKILKASDIEKLEKSSIQEALNECGGVKQKAAKLLGITPRQIDYKMKKYNISE
ncbi:MAG: sigma-54 interaction domain-containing protein [Campylobacterales bacterium]